MEKLLEKLKVTSKFTEDSEYLEGEAKQVEVADEIINYNCSKTKL